MTLPPKNKRRFTMTNHNKLTNDLLTIVRQQREVVERLPVCEEGLLGAGFLFVAGKEAGDGR